MRTQNSGVSFLCNADVMTSALFGTSKEVPNKTNLIYFNLGIHRCSISMVFSLFLETAYMLLCVQTQYVQITPWCLNFNTSALFKNLLKMHHKACFRKFSLSGPPAPSKRLSPVTSALPKMRKWDFSQIALFYMQITEGGTMEQMNHTEIHNVL